MSASSEVTSLVAKARTMQAKVDACESDGGHDYTVQGFSLIAHPDVVFNIFPKTEPKFASYACTRCGSRVSVEEGRAYMREKYKNSPARRREETREWMIDLYGEALACELYPYLFD